MSNYSKVNNFKNFAMFLKITDVSRDTYELQLNVLEYVFAQKAPMKTSCCFALRG